MTGVGFFVVTSLLLQAASNTRPQIKRRFTQRRKETQRRSLFFFAFLQSLRLCVKTASLALILVCGSFVMFLRHRLARYAILTLNPTAKIKKLTAFRTEGTERIVFPLDWFTAGWTLHES